MTQIPDIPAIADLPEAPTPLDTPETFDAKAFAMVIALNGFVDETNAAGTAIHVLGLLVESMAISANESETNANQHMLAADEFAKAAGASAEGAAKSHRDVTQLASSASTDAKRAENAAESAENRVPMTSSNGAALLPEGNDAQRPAVGSIPAGALLMRGNTQDQADYKPEFWDRVAAAWKVFADRTWVGKQIDNAIQTVKDWVNLQLGYVVIYPNGGTAESPAYVSINSRYTPLNPFPGYSVSCVAEVLYDGEWGNTGWMYQYAEGGRGVRASQLVGATKDVIVVQTGRTHLMTGAMDSGGGHVVGSPWNAPLKCRVHVRRVRGKFE